jgi:hypothetical protein
VTGERADDWRSPYPSSTPVVDRAVARRRRSNLPREICGMSQNVTEGEAIHSDRAAEVSKGCSTPRDRRKTRTVHRKKNKGKGK